MGNKICIATTFDRNYAGAGKTLFKSIRHHTNCEGVDFKVITADPEVVKEFGEENCHIVTHEIAKRYANVSYSKQLPPEKYSTSWYRYEVFNMGYDRVICIDSDCICVEDISYLFSDELNEYDLISVEDHFVSKVMPPMFSQLEAIGWSLKGLYHRISKGQIDIQPAVFAINKRVISPEWYWKLLAYANSAGFTYSIDQGILNDFIYQNSFKVKLLPLEWNYQDLYATRIPELPVPDKPIIVHCQESKPFRNNRADVDERICKFYDQWWSEHDYL